jgi:hypothetical protein
LHKAIRTAQCVTHRIVDGVIDVQLRDPAEKPGRPGFYNAFASTGCL